MNVQEKMNFISELLLERRNEIAAGWLGSIPPSRDMALLNQTHLLTATALGGGPRVARFAGAAEFAKGGSHVSFRGDVVVVANGPRKGITITPDQLREEEKGVTTVVAKHLKEGKGSRKVDVSRKNDVWLIEQVYDMMRGGVHPTGSLSAPTVYLAVKDESELICRVTADTMGILKSFDEYEYDMSPADNFQRLIPKMGIPVGNGRSLYPYSMCYGYGLLLVDVRARSDAVFIPSGGLDVSRGCVRVSVERYLDRLGPFSR